MKFRLFKQVKGTQDEIDTTNPYVRQLLWQDTHELDMQRMKRTLLVGVFLFFSLASGSIAMNFYQVMKAQDFYYFIMLDRDYQPVEAIARRADIMADSDPIKEGITANFLKSYVTWYRSRIMDEPSLLKQLNQARLQVSGIATVKFQADIDAHEPWKQIKKERVLVDIEGQPVRVSMDGKTKTWLVNWIETVQDATGVVLRQDKRNGHFLLAEDPKRVSTDNPFGLVVVDQEYR